MGFSKAIRKASRQSIDLEERVVTLIERYQAWASTEPKEERIALFNLSRQDKKLFPQAVKNLELADGARFINRTSDLYKEGNLISAVASKWLRETHLVVISASRITWIGLSAEPITINKPELNQKES